MTTGASGSPFLKLSSWKTDMEILPKEMASHCKDFRGVIATSFCFLSIAHPPVMFLNVLQGFAKRFRDAKVGETDHDKGPASADQEHVSVTDGLGNVRNGEGGWRPCYFNTNTDQTGTNGPSIRWQYLTA